MRIAGEHGDLARPLPRMPFAVSAIFDAPRAGRQDGSDSQQHLSRRARLQDSPCTQHTTLLHKVAVTFMRAACITQTCAIFFAENMRKLEQEPSRVSCNALGSVTSPPQSCSSLADEKSGSSYAPASGLVTY